MLLNRHHKSHEAPVNKHAFAVCKGYAAKTFNVGDQTLSVVMETWLFEQKPA